MSNFQISLVDMDEPIFSNFEEQYIFSEKDLEFEYNPFAFHSIQLYNPIFSTLSGELCKGNSQIMGQRYFFKEPDMVINLENGEVLPKNMFIKYSPLLDVYSYLIGKYEKDSSLNILPSLNPESCFKKYNSPHSISFVDSFFCYLSGRALNDKNLVNAVDFYGSFVGIKKMFKATITDDHEYLNKSPFFISNVNTKFKIDHAYYKSYRFNGSNAHRPKLCMDTRSSRISIGAEDMNIENIAEGNNNHFNQNLISSDFSELEFDVETLDNANSDKKSEEESNKGNILSKQEDSEEDILSYKNKDLKENGEEEREGEDASDDNSVDSPSLAYYHDSDSDLNYSSDDDEDGESTKSEDWTTCSENDNDDNDDEDEGDKNNEQKDEDSSNKSASDTSSDFDSDNDDESETDTAVVAYIPNYPVQMICLERYEGTIDKLFSKKEINEETGLAYLMQIIMTLLAYQTWFQFTHNDLHTNNIMYISTDKEYLVYKYEDHYYSVPTFGKIMKIIDFGRSIYRINGVVYCSDSFSKEGDAFGQYNTEPFMNGNKPRIDPNYSFDLCRLACSIYDFIIDHENVVNNSYEFDELQNTIIRWCLDDNKKNILYKTNGEERYPDFKLYKMIARNVHRHTPREELKVSTFSKYEINHTDLEELILSGKVKREDIMVIA